MPVRVLIVSGIWPPEVGGPASHGPELGRFLGARGHQVRAVTTCGPQGAEPAGFPLTAARKDRPVAVRQPAAALALAREVGRRPDVVYSTGMYSRSALATRLLRAPLVLKLASDPAYERARRSGRFSGTLEEFQATKGDASIRALKRVRTAAVRSAERLVIPSRYLAAIAAGWDIDVARIVVVPNPAPALNGAGAASRDELRRRFGFDRPTFVFAGRLTGQKNVSLAVTALAHVPGAQLVLIGDGPDRERVVAAVAAAGVEDRVRFAGALPRSVVMEWVRAADGTVLPSDWENFPHAAVESIAAGTPMIATAVGGVPEIVHDGRNGLLVAPGDEAGLAGAMRSVAGDAQLRARLREGSGGAAALYSAERAFEAIERELIATARR